jgi:hypothetical protein
VSEQKTFQQWLEEFEKEIRKGYENAAMVIALSEHVWGDRDKAPTTLLKLDSPPTKSTGGQFVTIEATLRNVKPLDAGIAQNLGDWSAHPEDHYMGMLMNQLGKYVADKEYEIIVEGLKNYAGKTIKSKQKGQLSKDDIREAQSFTVRYADSVIMNHQQMNEFLINGQIFEPLRIPESFVPKERRGYYYSGMISAVNVYWASFVKDFALVFDRGEIIFANTPLKIAFDNMESPKRLILHKMCVAAPMFDQAVVKIEVV